MNEAARSRTARERDAALARLRSLTTGTAVAAIVATGGFGALAAITYSGQPTVAAAAGASGVGDTSTLAEPDATAGVAQATPSPSPSSTSSGLQAPTATPRTTSQKSHASSGGSG